MSPLNFKTFWFEVCVFDLECPPQPPLSSYANANDDSPDCSGGPKFLRNKSPDGGVFKITYTYSVKFVVGALVSLSHRLALLLASKPDWQDALLMCRNQLSPAAFLQCMERLYLNYAALTHLVDDLDPWCLCRRIRRFVGHQDGTTSWSRCLTPTSSGSGQSADLRLEQPPQSVQEI